jgi:hypothetical protein
MAAEEYALGEGQNFHLRMVDSTDKLPMHEHETALEAAIFAY